MSVSAQKCIWVCSKIPGLKQSLEKVFEQSSVAFIEVTEAQLTAIDKSDKKPYCLVADNGSVGPILF